MAQQTAAKPGRTKTRRGAATTALARRRRALAAKTTGSAQRGDRRVLGPGAVAVAMLFGGIGFAFHLFWIGAIVVLAVLLGSMLSEQRGNRQGGAVLDVVAAVVDDVRDAGSKSA